MTSIVRGAAVFITVIFKDEDGATIIPSNATMRLRYRAHNRETSEIVALQGDVAGNFSAVWDSANADAGSVEWWAQSADTPKAAAQGMFSLAANGANPSI